MVPPRQLIPFALPIMRAAVHLSISPRENVDAQTLMQRR
jgi:hypothetical protein